MRRSTCRGRSCNKAPGSLTRGQITRHDSLAAAAGEPNIPSERLDWIPSRRAQPSVCVVSVMTSELLADWGGVAVESNANWAVAHGYRYTVFTRLLAPLTLHAVWSNPRAAESDRHHLDANRPEDVYIH